MAPAFSLGRCEAVRLRGSLQVRRQNGLDLGSQRDTCLSTPKYGVLCWRGGVDPDFVRAIDVGRPHLQHFRRPHAGQQLQPADRRHRRRQKRQRLFDGFDCHRPDRLCLPGLRLSTPEPGHGLQAVKNVGRDQFLRDGPLEAALDSAIVAPPPMANPGLTAGFVERQTGDRRLAWPERSSIPAKTVGLPLFGGVLSRSARRKQVR